MKIAGVLFIISVYYTAITEQRAAAPVRMHTSRNMLEEMEHKAMQGMKDFKMNAYALSHDQRVKAQFNIPTDPLELAKCANQNCEGEESLCG